MALEAAALVRDPVWRGAGVPRGAGRPVLLIPGFLAGDGSFSLMTRWLRELGYHASRSGIGVNVDCSDAACVRLDERLERLADRFGERVAIVGQSRGGTMARVLAVRRPDLVSGIVTLASPLRAQLSAVHPLVLAHVGVVGALGSLGRPGLFTHRCLRGDCCRDFRADLCAPFPPEVGFVCLYSRSDGILDWRACLDAHASEHVEVSASHCGMSFHAGAYRAIGAALGGFAAAEQAGWAEAA